MKAMKALFQKETWIRGMLGVAAFIMVVSLQTFTSLAASGKVIAETAKIRSEASTGSSVVGSTVKGKTIDIVGAVKDSAGTVWYKVPNGNNTYGYIRSDLVETSDDIKVEAASAATTTTTTTTEKPADTVPTSIGEQAATVAVESAKIRSGASTSHDPIASLSKGESITLIGEATDSAGKKWYQIRFTKNGSSREGYIRSDLITLGASDAAASTDGSQTDGSDAASTDGSEETPADGENVDGAEQTETEKTEETQEDTPAEPEHNDYEVVYNDETYWLYDNVNGTMMSVTNLLDVVNQTGADNQSLQKQVTTEKIIIIVMAVVVVILIAAVTILIFKLKDAYYYEDYEDEEEEIEEEPEHPVKKKKKQSREMDYEEEPVPVKKKRTREREDFYEEEERPVRQKTRQEADLTAAEEKKPAKKSARKAQNFLVDDDEFEFEFLNMDDKDL